MMIAKDSREIGEVLKQHRSFEECLLREVRTTRFGTAVELRFGYVWDNDDPAGIRAADEPLPVTLHLELVREIRLMNELPAAVLAAPERADWGLTEVALVRLETSSELIAAHHARSAAPLHHLVVEWEGDRRLDVVFERLTCADDPGDAR